MLEVAICILRFDKDWDSREFNSGTFLCHVTNQSVHTNCQNNDSLSTMKYAWMRHWVRKGNAAWMLHPGGMGLAKSHPKHI